jgi:proline racemase
MLPPSPPATCRDSKCERVRFVNVPSFVVRLDAPLEVPGLPPLTIDIAYGGAFFALVDAQALGLSLMPGDARRCVELGEKIKAAAAAAYPVAHPDPAQGAGAITFVEFVLPVAAEGDLLTGRNAVVVSPGKIDRSPCGTGTSARLAVLHARGQIAAGQTFVSRSIIGSEFIAEVVETTTVHGMPAVVPTISGRAWITSMGQYGLDPTDPFPEGYVVSDTWHQHPLGHDW